MQNRFIDDGIHLSWFEQDTLVRCPNCIKEAKVVSGAFSCTYCDFKPSVPDAYNLTCTGCKTHIAQFKGQVKLIECGNCGRRNYKSEFYEGSGSQSKLKIRSIQIDPESGRDEYYGIELLLLASYRGKTLWFYNYAHLEYVESYLRADVRERLKGGPNNSLIARLPSWIKQGKSKNDLLKKITLIKKLYVNIDG